MKVAFIGLGVMGYPMAGHLKKAGLDVCVYNRTTAKAEQWCQQYAGTMAATPAEAATGCEIVLCWEFCYSCTKTLVNTKSVIASTQATIRQYSGGRWCAILLRNNFRAT